MDALPAPADNLPSTKALKLLVGTLATLLVQGVGIYGHGDRSNEEEHLDGLQ